MTICHSFLIFNITYIIPINWIQYIQETANKSRNSRDLSIMNVINYA